MEWGGYSASNDSGMYVTVDNSASESDGTDPVNTDLYGREESECVVICGGSGAVEYDVDSSV